MATSDGLQVDNECGRILPYLRKEKFFGTPRTLNHWNKVICLRPVENIILRIQTVMLVNVPGVGR
ncbi:MAG: hypothetical protein E7K68_07615, partial [Corynebacterium kroppenstedtii]|nr:hypothetical protein [Corynebacterium kroppenstedtii]